MELEIDLRAKVPAVRDQKDRETCLAFAISAAHTHHHSRLAWLSVEYLFYYALQLMSGKDPSLGLTFAAVEGALRDEGQPEESAWPYLPDAVPPLPKPPTDLEPIWRAKSHWAHHQDVAAAIAELEHQRLMILGVQLSPGFYRLPESPYLIDDTGSGFGGHAVLAVGVGKSSAGERLVLIQNSWGIGWGDSGYAWLSSRFLESHLIGHMTIE
jgi:Papain family cysteine protease